MIEQADWKEKVGFGESVLAINSMDYVICDNKSVKIRLKVKRNWIVIEIVSFVIFRKKP